MNEIAPYTDTTWMGGLELPGPPEELRLPDVPPMPIPDAAPGSADDFVRPHANEQANSRVNCRLPEGKWEIAWKAGLPAGTAPRHILRHAGRIVVVGGSQWHLFGLDGSLITTGAADQGGVTLDSEHRLFFSMTRSGYLAARNLDDGSPAFYIEIDYGEAFFHPFLTARKGRLLASGVERQLVPNATSALASSLQLMDVGTKPVVDKDRILTSFKTLKTLMRKDDNIHVAVNGDTCVIAAEGLLYLADPEFSIQRAFTGPFSPISMSLDEGSNIYLLARTTGPISTLVLVGTTPEGSMLCMRNLSGRVSPGASPPVIGFDHTIYLLLDHRISAFTRLGSPLWEGHGGGSIAGGVVTLDGQLVVAAGNLISVFDTEGHMTIVHSFEGEALCSQPLPCADGSLYVATEDNLYRLIATKN
jgi:hypothetical protein